MTASAVHGENKLQMEFLKLPVFYEELTSTVSSLS